MVLGKGPSWETETGVPEKSNDDRSLENCTPHPLRYGSYTVEEGKSMNLGHPVERTRGLSTVFISISHYNFNEHQPEISLAMVDLIYYKELLEYFM